MRKLVLKMSMSLDGFVGGPNGETDWMMRSRDEDGAKWVVETLRNAGVHAVGSRTYLEWADFWPTAPGIFAAPMNDIPKVVFTRQKALTLKGKGNWSTAEVANGDLAEEIQRLKAQDGKDILAQGGAGFCRSLVRLGLVDEYRLVVHPVALGAGLGLFSELERPQDLNLVSATVFRSGVMAHVYRPG